MINTLSCVLSLLPPFLCLLHSFLSDHLYTHQGHEKEALNLMASYLPKDSPNSSPYAEGGGLYAIGLIHANHGQKVMDYLANELRSNTSEIVCHGACLGLGLAAMGTCNYDMYDLLKENLMTRDDAVVGEAAGLAMGLVMIGTKSADSLEDMLNYARDTQHEKIQRGLALGISMYFPPSSSAVVWANGRSRHSH
jgi:26S proteasome regulatory subunit N2